MIQTGPYHVKRLVCLTRRADARGGPMRTTIARALPVHYAWIVAAVIFVTLLTGVGIRATPSVLIVPLEEAFGWSRTTISFAISINIVLFGLMGPFAAALMQQIGIRRTVLLALALLAVSVAASTLMTQPWQLILSWGLAVGLGTGVTTLVLGATIVNRWFAKNQGLVMGIITASTATGQLVFLPLLAAVIAAEGWRSAVWITAIAAAVMIPVVALLLPENPADIGLRPYGATADVPPPPPRANPIVVAFPALGRAAESGGFWLLFASFFLCAASTHRLIP